MRKPLALTLLLLTTLAWAQTIPTAGQIYESVSCDLNGDGKPEKVGLRAYNIDIDAESFWGQLVVIDSTGKTLWTAPKATTAEQTFAFGVFPYGASNLEWLGDLDGDSKIELLSPEPVSNVRPPTYRRYRWNGKSFAALSSKMLLEVPAGSGTFAWRDPIEWDGVSPLCWVAGLSGAPNKKVAEIVSSREGGAIWGGQAEMSGNGLGLRAVNWTKKLGPEV